MPAPLYTPDLGQSICDDVAAGGYIDATAAKHGICRRTVYNWRDRYPDFAAELKMALDIQADVYFDRAMQAADASHPGNHQSQRLKHDAAIGRASFLSMLRYGIHRRVALEHTGKDGAPLIPALSVTIARE